jgi:hypothetical protein
MSEESAPSASQETALSEAPVEPVPQPEFPAAQETSPAEATPPVEPTPPLEQPVAEDVASVPEPVVQEASPKPKTHVTGSPTAESPKPRSSRERMLTVVRARKAERLEKIVALAREKKIITNDDVQKMLTVSNASATNYLHELVKTGRLSKTGIRAGSRYHAV